MCGAPVHSNDAPNTDEEQRTRNERNQNLKRSRKRRPIRRPIFSRQLPAIAAEPVHNQASYSTLWLQRHVVWGLGRGAFAWPTFSPLLRSPKSSSASNQRAARRWLARSLAARSLLSRRHRARTLEPTSSLRRCFIISIDRHAPTHDRSMPLAFGLQKGAAELGRGGGGVSRLTHSLRAPNGVCRAR